MKSRLLLFGLMAALALPMMAQKATATKADAMARNDRSQMEEIIPFKVNENAAPTFKMNRGQMLWDFDSHYRAVLNDQIGASAMGVVPIGTPDGFFVDGQYIVYGDLNLNGRFDEGDAELYELIAQEYEAARAGGGGYEYSLRNEQYALASNRYINSEGNYKYIKLGYREMAALIRQYVEMSEAGAELPQDLGNFDEQYIAGQENP